MNQQSDDAATTAPEFLSGPGPVRARMRALDWSATPLGAPAAWPQSLKTVVRLMLDSRYAMWLAWGPRLTFFCNDAYLPTVGTRDSWVLGASARDVWSEIWPEIGPRIDRVLTTGSATWDEGLLLFLERRGFAEETYHTFSYSPVHDDAGAVQGMLCVVTEDTAKRLGERRLRTIGALASAALAARSADEACRQAAAALAENAHDVPFALIYLHDADKGVARLAASSGVEAGASAAPMELALESPAAAWPLGRAAGDDAVAFAIDERVAPLVAGPWPDPIERALVLPLAAAGQSERLAGSLVVGLGTRLVFDDDYRSFLSLVAGQVASAISDARAFEEEKRRAEALAELDRAKTTFFSNVSHEFRTPLTLMLAPIDDVLAVPGLPGDKRQLLDVAKRNGRRMQKLVNTLLDFSRIEAGRMRGAFEPVDLPQLTADLATVFRAAMEKAGLAYTIDCAPLAEPVRVDREMWEKIVLNLISNALKYTFEGEVRVTLHAQRDAAVLEVSDTGIGIPESALPRLFERFFRIPNARGRSHEGSGIGLALVAELVKLHGGTIGVTSRQGRGSRFTVRVPFGASHLPPDQLSVRGDADSNTPVEVVIEEIGRASCRERV